MIDTKIVWAGSSGMPVYTAEAYNYVMTMALYYGGASAIHDHVGPHACAALSSAVGSVACARGLHEEFTILGEGDRSVYKLFYCVKLQAPFTLGRPVLEGHQHNGNSKQPHRQQCSPWEFSMVA
jgi:hypothetical protein